MSRLALYPMLYSVVGFALALGNGSASIASASAPQVDVYHPDPDHLWNRLYATFFVRTTEDGRTLGGDLLEPMLFEQSHFPLTDPTYTRACELLDEFLDSNAEQAIQDPLKRAFLQRDLWAVFDWLAHPDSANLRYTGHLTTQRRELQRRIAKVLQRLAISPEQIRALPDNYAAAVDSRVFPAEFDAANRDRAFLPPDLMNADSDWVLVAHMVDVPAPAHVLGVTGRSAFSVHIKLPEGRSAGLAYLNRIVNSHVAPGPTGATQAALVRHMLLIDDRGAITRTPIVEEVQLVDSPTIKPDFYHFILTRKDLFDHRAGGLHARLSHEFHFSAFDTVFAHTREDPFENPSRASTRLPTKQLELTDNQNMKLRCVRCHVPPGGPPEGLRALAHLTLQGTPPTRGRRYLNLKLEDVLAQTILWKQRHYSWGLLEGLWAGGEAN